MLLQVAHDARTHACTTPRCGCTAFAATFSCSCGASWANHATVVETRDERKAAGRPVDNLLGGGAGYEALGGVTSFASLADGACSFASVQWPGLSSIQNAGYERAALGLGAEQPPLPAVSRLRSSEPQAAVVIGEDADGTRGGPLFKLKAARAAARSRASSAEPPPPSPPPPPWREAESYAEKRSAAAERASEVAAARRVAAEAAEARAIAELPELEQLHRLSLARDRAGRR